MSALAVRKTFQKILVMRYRFIGDTLLLIPFLRNLRHAYPDAVIDVLVASDSGALLANCPYINQLIYMDVSSETGQAEQDPKKSAHKKSLLQIAAELKKNQYDTAFVLKRSFSSALLAFLAGIPNRIGFNTECRGFLLSQSVTYDVKQSEKNCFLDCLKACDIPVSDLHLEYWPSESSQQKIQTLLAENQLLDPHQQHIVTHWTSSNTAKQWTPEAAFNLSNKLMENPTVHLHCLGAEKDRAIYQAIAEKLSDADKKRYHIWCGQFSLLESMAFLSKMNLLVGVDSGTLHMASAVGLPVVALFGPMNPEKWAPDTATVLTENLPCRPCDLKSPCHLQYQCMGDLTVERVLDQCQTVLSP